MKPLLWILSIAVALLVSAPSAAEAKGIVIINTGSDILYMHDIPEAALKEMPDLTGYKVGYKYSLFGVFWLDIWRWDGELVVYKGNEYAPIPADEAELLGGAGAPIGYRVPPGLLAILCGVLLALGAAVKRNRGVIIGLTVGAAAGTVALYLMGLGMSTILPACTAVALLVMAFSKDDPEPADFHSDPQQPQAAE